MSCNSCMSSKEMIYSAIDGGKLDKYPIIAPYMMLSNADHWVELTRLPVWKFYEWCIEKDPVKHAQTYRTFFEKLPFDAVQPWIASKREYRENVSIVHKDGNTLYYDKKQSKYWKVPENIHESSSGGGENETRIIHSREDVKEKIKIHSAQKLIENGCNDYLQELISLYGNSKFVINGGIVNTFYSNVYYLGMTNFYVILYH